MKKYNTILKIQDNFIITVLRHALSMLIPFMLIGGLANVVLYFPVSTYQEFINGESMEWLRSMLYAVVQGTFGLFSFAIVITLSMSYAMEKNEKPEDIAMYVVVSLGSFGAQLNIGTRYFDISNLGVTGYTSAIIITLLVCVSYSRLRKSRFLTLGDSTVGMEGICANAVKSFFPALIIIGSIVLLTRLLIHFTGASNINQILSNVFISIFDSIDTTNNYATGLLYTFLVHILWFMGFHGSNVLEPVALSKFQITANNEVFTKSFFDVFVVMGGCGVTVCVFIILLIRYRKHRLGNLAVIASPSIAFNVNEVLNFGIPIMLNPVLLIPFITAPAAVYSISYLAVYMGIVPNVANEVVWTTPVFFSGYIATGSYRGVLLQLVTILTGIIIYYPFIKIHVKVEEKQAGKQIKGLIQELQEYEEISETPDFLQRTDKMGIICKVLLKDLKRAIEKDDIYLLYQPQVDENGKCIGAEALLRWEHPVYGFIYPPLTIYLAKNGNVLEELEKVIFDKAVSSVRRISEEYDGDFKISVNITAKSLLWDIETCIKECLDKYNVPAEKIWIEITEQDMISKAEYIVEKLDRLKNVGHTLLIDDFGMGHTSLLYLQSNFFDVVKLDGSLIKNITGNKTNQKIVASIVELARELGIEVIAEFVETKEERDMLYRLGCKWYQGYLYSRPVPLDDFIRYIAECNNA